VERTATGKARGARDASSVVDGRSANEEGEGRERDGLLTSVDSKWDITDTSDDPNCTTRAT
jgi:hypothetical protein